MENPFGDNAFMRECPFIRAVVAGVALLTLIFLGCQPEPGHLAGGDFDPTVRSRDPAILESLLASTATPEQVRTNADRRLVEVKGARDEGRLGVLDEIVAGKENSDVMRIYALDQLATADAERAVHGLSLGLPGFEGELLADGCDWAMRLKDKQLIDALVRSMERGLELPRDEGALRGRPEWRALEKLGEGDVKETLYGKVEHSEDPGLRVAALDLLEAIEPEAAIKERLLKMDHGDAWLEDLRWWVDAFDALPTGAMEMEWIHYLRQPAQAEMVARALRRHEEIKGQSDYVAAPRFVYVLANANAAAVAMSREGLITGLKQRLAMLRHAHRVPEYPHARDDVDDTLDGEAKNLSRADLLAINLLLTGLADRGTIAELERQGLADIADVTTEHGGLVTMPDEEHARLAFVLYPPLFALNNFEYVSSDQLLLETARGIAEYHFHFQEVHNEVRAGPGTGDLGYSRRMRCNCVVITSTDVGELNVDYYTPGDAVVDLGVYRADGR